MKRFFSLILLAIFTAGCGSGIRVVSDMDPDADFTSYKTYFFLPWNKDNGKLLSEFDKKRLYMAVANQMDNRGYKKVDEKGDLAVAMNILLEKKNAQRAYTSYYGGYGYGYGGMGFGYSTTSYQNYQYWQGTLVIDVFDAGRKELIWQGAAIGSVDGDPNTREEKINDYVDRIFWEYPIDD